MEPCNHTRLMNCIIGMCKKHRDWICVLAELGYEPQIIEKQMRTSSDEVVQPDVVATSNRLLHSLVFDCKGGVTVDADQLRRYSTLTEDDLLRWVTVFARQGFHFDICISDLEKNHAQVASVEKMFPILTFCEQRLFKTGTFKEEELNEAFKDPVDLQGKTSPLSYYPFCEEDDNAYIAMFVIRGMVSVAIKNAKGGPSTSDENTITRDDLIRNIFNPVFDALSSMHKSRLKEKIKEVIRGIMAKDEMREALGMIELQAGYKISRPLERFSREADKFLEQLRTQQTLVEFMGSQGPSEHTSD